MSETAEQRRIRLAAEQQAEAAIAWTQGMLRLGLLLPEERIVAGGLAIGPGYRETWAEHVRSLEWILTLLLGLRRRLAEGPVPDSWRGDVLSATDTIQIEGSDHAARHLRRYFDHYAYSVSPARLTLVVEQHLSCVTPSWSDRATPTGISIAVPDPSRPEIVERITSTVTPRGTIFDLWRDERRRLFYLGFGRRQYVLETESGLPVF